MLKSTLFVLTGFLLVSIVRGDASAPINRPRPVAPTASQICKLKGYSEACANVMSDICKSMRCRSLFGVVSTVGDAPDGMFCGIQHVCYRGQCVRQEIVGTPTKNLLLVDCV